MSVTRNVIDRVRNEGMTLRQAVKAEYKRQTNVTYLAEKTFGKNSLVHNLIDLKYGAAPKAAKSKPPRQPRPYVARPPRQPAAPRQQSPQPIQSVNQSATQVGGITGTLNNQLRNMSARMTNVSNNIERLTQYFSGNLVQKQVDLLRTIRDILRGEDKKGGKNSKRGPFKSDGDILFSLDKKSTITNTLLKKLVSFFEKKSETDKRETNLKEENDLENKTATNKNAKKSGLKGLFGFGATQPQEGSGGLMSGLGLGIVGGFLAKYIFRPFKAIGSMLAKTFKSLKPLAMTGLRYGGTAIKTIASSVGGFVGRGASNLFGGIKTMLPKMLSLKTLTGLGGKFASGSMRKIISSVGGAALGGPAGLALGLILFPAIDGISEYMKSGSMVNGLSQFLSSLTFDIIDKETIKGVITSILNFVGKLFDDADTGIGEFFQSGFDEVKKALGLMDTDAKPTASKGIASDFGSIMKNALWAITNPGTALAIGGVSLATPHKQADKKTYESPLDKIGKGISSMFGISDAKGADNINGLTDTKSEFNPKVAQLFDVIHKAESPGSNNGYDVAFSGTGYKKFTNGKPLTELSLNEIMELQKKTGKEFGSSAIGRYQFMSKTLGGLKKELNLTGNEKFDKKLQDRLGYALLKRRGLDNYLSGKMSKSNFMDSLAQEWAGLPNSKGVSPYAGVGLNKGATIGMSPLSNALDNLKGLSPKDTQKRPDISTPTSLASNLNRQISAARDSALSAASSLQNVKPKQSGPAKVISNPTVINTGNNSKDHESGINGIISHLLGAMGVTTPH